MKLTQCAAFVAVAETASFTRAAQRLGISQSAVSHAVSALERELGITLMDRGRAGTVLTVEGQQVIRHAQAVVHHADLVVSRARGSQATDGKLRVGASPGFASRLLPRLIADIAAHHPGLQVAVREGSDLQIGRWLREGGVDVGIVHATPPELTAAPLVREAMCAVVAQDHPLAGADAVSCEQLARVPLIIPAWDPEAAQRVFRGAGVEFTVPHHIQDLTTVLAMVGEGLGVAVLSELVLPEVPLNLRRLPLTPAVSRQLSVVVGAGAADEGRASAFVAAARRVAARRAAAHPGPQPLRTSW
ncbi:LysR family transcriptional regulator [Streptomyces gamaensis]|uniref:LysR family transcriptional regulator n=1 Tax=Streptomyces gamaensis TaxID=1763542 RepID=A0ABW0YWC3_9ACTN